MNSDKFDRVVLDLLYGELDELTTAAAKRHMDQSARAREIFAHFKATRQLSVLPTHSPPPDFEAALMDRERRALAELPLHHRIGRIVSMLAGYAMRPQLIMGALLLLMIGSSLMFLRARPGQHSAVQVTERGAPEADIDLVLPVPPKSEADPTLSSGVFSALPAADSGHAAASPAALAPTPRASEAGKLVMAGASRGASAIASRSPLQVAAEGSSEGLDPFDQALESYREGHYVEAQRRFDRISRTGGARAAEAALYSAQSFRNVSGCAPAVNRFERVRLDFPGSASAYEAAWRTAKCLQQLGDMEAARQSYESLLDVASHAARARTALAALGVAPAKAKASGKRPLGSDSSASSAPAKPGRR
jgi:TolA-binding protein